MCVTPKVDFDPAAFFEYAAKIYRMRIRIRLLRRKMLALKAVKKKVALLKSAKFPKSRVSNKKKRKFFNKKKNGRRLKSRLVVFKKRNMLVLIFFGRKLGTKNGV